MALINCAECGRQISDKAKNCPGCGAPIMAKKFCKHCGKPIDEECVVCPLCGKQVENLQNTNDNNIVINNNAVATSNANIKTPASNGKEKNKWISLLLCIFTICGHKFYEGKIIMGIIYLFTCGILGIGWIIDIISLLCKPNPYYV